MTRHVSIVVTFSAAALITASGATASAGEYYIEPSLFPSTNIINALGVELSPIIMREDLGYGVLPTQSFFNFSVQGALSKNSSIELAWGHVTRSMVPSVSNPFQRLNLELKARSQGENFWYLFFLDLDWARTTFGGSDESINSAAFTMGEMIGFRVKKFMAEISLGFLGYLVLLADHEIGWTDGACFEIPLGVRFGYNIIERGAVDLELRFPLLIGMIEDASIYVPLDMSVGYQHIIGDSWILRGAIYWAVTERDFMGREQLGMILSVKWVFF